MATQPTVLQIEFATEPHFTLKYSSVSPSSSDSDTEDRIVPFTLSPLDECRGVKARNYAITVRGVHATAHKKTKKRHTTRAH
jgi:hypothetical protein